MLVGWYLIAVTLASSVITGDCLFCDDAIEIATGTCTKILKDLERALLQDEGNLSRMRRAFFHSPTAAPVLLKVVYNITYAKNITTANAVNEAPHCDSSSAANSTIEFKERDITYGWTSSGVYAVFHPTVINMMQAQSPFALLRIMYLTLPDQRSPEADTFLWDGSYDLPTVHLNMHISSLSCVPSQDMFESVFMDINTLLKVYAGQQESLNFIQDHEAIGFTLPSTSVSTYIVPTGTDVAIINLYSSILCFLYLITVCLLPFWFLRQRNERQKHITARYIDARIQDNEELIAGMVTTGVTTIALEFCARIANCIVWTVHRDNGLGNFRAIWLPQGYIFLFGTSANVVVHIVMVVYKKCCCCNDDESDINDSEIPSSRMHIILVLHLTMFGLLYSLPPAIILTFAYPTLMIAIFTFILAYLFATTIFFAILIKFYRSFECNCIGETSKKIGFGLIFVLAWLTMLYIYVIALVFLYVLIIGRGSVINTGPLLAISLFPSVFLSVVAWIAKRIVLNTNRERNVGTCGQRNEQELNPVVQEAAQDGEELN